MFCIMDNISLPIKETILFGDICDVHYGAFSLRTFTIWLNDLYFVWRYPMTCKLHSIKYFWYTYNIIACECIPCLCWANTSCVQLFIRNSFCWKRFYLLVRDLWEGMMGQSKWDEKMYSNYSHTFLHLVYVSFKINIERCSTFNENTTNSVTRFINDIIACFTRGIPSHICVLLLSFEVLFA